MIEQSRPAIEKCLAGPWWRVLAMAAPGARPGRDDFAMMRPAAIAAAQAGRCLVTGWLSRGNGAPLELITTIGPPATGPADRPRDVPRAGEDPELPGHGRHAVTVAEDVPFPEPLLFPDGAWGVPAGGGYFGELDQLVWVPCPGYPATPGRAAEPGQASEPGLFEAALAALMRRPFGWLVVAEPTDLMAAETAELQTELDILKRHRDQHTAAAVERTERRLAELTDFAEAGLWRARVLAGASSPDELDVLAPLLAGAADLSLYPYRLRSARGARSLAEALSSQIQDAMDGAQSPFFVTAGMLTALAGLPRLGVPGLSMPSLSRAAEPDRRNGHDAAGVNGSAAPINHRPGSGAGPGHRPAVSIDLGAGPEGGGPVTVPLSALGHGALVAGSAGSGTSHTVRYLLGQLTAAGVPWLAAGPATPGATVINPADPDAIPLTISPFAPEPGYPVLAHIAMVGSLFDAAFGADEPFSLITSQALRRVYQAAGWDLVTGRAAPGAVAAPALPELGDLHAAILDAAGRSGYDRRTRARLRAQADARFGSLRAGSAGRFAEGGHPADIGALLTRDVGLALHDLGAEEDRAFLTGAVLIRVAEHLRLRARAEPPSGLRHVLVLDQARGLLRDRGRGQPATRAAERFAALIAELASYGTGTVITEQRPALLVGDAVRNAGVRIVHRLPARDDVQAVTGLPGGAARRLPYLEPGTAMVLAGPAGRPSWVRVHDRGADRASPSPIDALPLLGGRHSAACGRHCRELRACRLSELHQAEVAAQSAGHAWLRLWGETLLLAFLTDRPLPGVPGPLGRRWRSLGVRPRECLLARVVDAAVGRRADALRSSFDPARFTGIVAAAALTRLDDAASTRPGAGGVAPGARTGPAWVIPQLRWLHEAERLCPLSGPALAPGDQAPPLDFDLVGLPDWPGIRAGQRARALRRHPLSMAQAANRRLAWTALAGRDGPAALAADLAAVAAGAEPAAQVRYVAGLMGASWLETVLSWPRRFIASPAGDGPARGLGQGPGRGLGDAADGPPGGR